MLQIYREYMIHEMYIVYVTVKSWNQLFLEITSKVVALLKHCFWLGLGIGLGLGLGLGLGMGLGLV